MLSPEQQTKFKDKARDLCRQKEHDIWCQCAPIEFALTMAFYDGQNAGIADLSDKLREAHAERTA